MPPVHAGISSRYWTASNDALASAARLLPRDTPPQFGNSNESKPLRSRVPEVAWALALRKVEETIESVPETTRSALAGDDASEEMHKMSVLHVSTLRVAKMFVGMDPLLLWKFTSLSYVAMFRIETPRMSSEEERRAGLYRQDPEYAHLGDRMFHIDATREAFVYNYYLPQEEPARPPSLPVAHVIGAGPVGLLCCAAAHSAAFRTDLFEQRGVIYKRKQIIVVDPGVTARLKSWGADAYFNVAIPIPRAKMQTEEDERLGVLQPPPPPALFQPRDWEAAFGPDPATALATPRPTTAALKSIEMTWRKFIMQQTATRIHHSFEYRGVSASGGLVGINLEAPGHGVNAHASPDIVVVSSGATRTTDTLREWAFQGQPDADTVQHAASHKAFVLYGVLRYRGSPTDFVPRSDIVREEARLNRWRSRGFKTRDFAYVAVALDTEWKDTFQQWRTHSPELFRQEAFRVLQYHGRTVHDIDVVGWDTEEPESMNPVILEIEMQRMDRFYVHQQDNNKLVVFVGDAAATPHFFSGSGLNTGAWQSYILSTLLSKFHRDGRFTTDALQEFDDAIRDSVDAMHQRSAKYIALLEHPDTKQAFDKFMAPVSEHISKAPSLAHRFT